MLNRLLHLISGKKHSPTTPGSKEPRPPVHHAPKVAHSPIDESDLDPDAVRIVRRLVRFENTAYLVGGCVRDLLLDRHPKDFDIGTSATPRQVKRIFRNCRIIGRRFRLAHIYFQNRKIIEVATFRAIAGKKGLDHSDEDTTDQDLLIRDDNVFGTPEEDALRRDFTINQLFYDVVEGNIIDHADGLSDLRRRAVRTIGDPEVRFREDPIRILRAIKFAARLDFKIEDETMKAIHSTAKEIPRAAPPRVLEEINRFCMEGAARKSFDLLRETGVFQVILPEFGNLYEGSPRAWEALDNLLEAIDLRHKEGKKTATGEILAVLALPLLFKKLGWSDAGTANWPRGMDVRKVVDDLNRPLAQRLRVARKDQEVCRAIIMTLFRMVPHKKTRPSTRKAILHRPCLPQALWILERLGQILGNEFQDAATFWEEHGKNASAPREQRDREDSGRQDPGAGRSGRKRRPQRRRTQENDGETQAGQEEQPPKKAPLKKQPTRGRKPTPKKEPDPNMPSPWSDNYFFAALPSVPESGPSESGTEPDSGALEPDIQEENQESPATDETSGDETNTAPRKRRRRRRRKKPADTSSD
jgi:poly(A) polymerase